MAREFLGKNISLIIESNYKQDYDAPLILDLIKNVSCDCLQIICQARGDLLAERYTQRILKSERPHELNTPGIIEEFQTKLLHATEPPLKIPGRQILVDTNDFSTVDLKSIISEVQVFLN